MMIMAEAKVSKQKILITGASGLVGHALRGVLNGHELLMPTHKEVDYTDQVATTAYFQKTKPDFVYHLSAKVGGIAANVADPSGFFYDNMIMNMNVIRAAYDAGVKKFLYLGSSCMYPKDRDILHEQDLMTGMLEPTNEGYAFSKLGGLLFCQYLSKQYGVHYKTIIPTNLYGEHDHFDLSRSHLIPAIIMKIHHAKTTGQPSIEIWGDGKARREFMYVGDLADALLKAFNDFDALPAVMNIGLGHDYSINEYYAMATHVMGYTGTFQHDLSKPVGMQRKLLDVSKAAAWGFVASTDIAEGILRVYAHVLKTGILK
jgi:GDP-L-fucose synthase